MGVSVVGLTGGNVDGSKAEWELACSIDSVAVAALANMVVSPSQWKSPLLTNLSRAFMVDPSRSRCRITCYVLSHLSDSSERH